MIPSESPPHPLPAAPSGRRPIDRLAACFLECWRDERGTALTEYTVVMLATLPALFFLFHPDNGFYQAARDENRMTQAVLLFPGH